MDSLSDLLAGKGFEEPPEVAAIKSYVRDTFGADVQVQLRDNGILIVTSSAALASQLRFATQALREVAQTDKRLFFRIGS
jgi:hypothetical protein